MPDGDNDDDQFAPAEAEIAFVQGMVRDLPFLEGLLAEHVEGYGEILSTLFMADVAQFLRGEGMEQADPGMRAAILGWAERALTSGDELAGVIVVTGLLEALQDLQPEEEYLVEEMGPELRREFSLVRIPPAQSLADGEADEV